LAIEKLLKGLVIIKTNNEPPRVHDLERLAVLAKLSLTEDQTKHLKIITRFCMACRYPDEKFAFYKKCTKDYTEKYYNICKELFLWLKRQYPKK